MFFPLSWKNVVVGILIIIFSYAIQAGTMGTIAHHPLEQGKWNLSINGGIADTRFTDSSTVLRFSGIDINGNLNLSGVLGAGNDYYFNKLFSTHYFYGLGINYAYTNNLEWGVEFEGSRADGQRYRRNTRIGFFDQTYGSYESYSGYLQSTYYFDNYIKVHDSLIHPFVGAKVGISYRPEVVVSNDFLDGFPVTFDGKSSTIFYKSSSSVSGGIYTGLMMNIKESLAAFIKVGIMASDGLLGHNLFNKTVAIRPIQKASVSNSGAIISIPVMIGVKKFFN
ncbi:hypothetical protein [Legionella jamestowniensis]|uniref:Outer membrane protein beta-barrel domain-containing protein n=2 Tax=Legionella jamestowniensis TaxID=455 RepID=A0A0W0UKN1_9GAMM|nr:hypothetical protein [Legionella jamestowniensis]KTD08319.1 hypothetical protein Ljam_2514 [Legionella jamestowniensis]OCH97155.1 hypothetical protein A8135_05885 [Legionella jamestowniensis]SFL49690.1 hypothetical protein SAMN02746073_0451 [Legionella jamestowniensis DSM 19215]